MSFALITGASKGIGKSIAQELAARGHDLLLVSRNAAALELVAVEIRQSASVNVFWKAMDLAEPNAAEAIFEWLKHQHYDVDILVNNAGYGQSGPFMSYNVEEYSNMINLNILSLVKLCRFFIAAQTSARPAYIMNIASTAAYQAVPGLSLYAASKIFVLNFSRGLAYELRKTAISVTAVSPGATDTGFAERAKIGAKGLKAAEKVNMTPEAVAKIGVDAMFKRKKEVITGWLNKLSAGFSQVLPKSLVEKIAGSIYE